MNAICVNQNICSEVLEKGFSCISGEDFFFDKSLEFHKDIFMKTWDDLVLDECMADNGKYRFRRFGTFNFQPLTGELEYQPNTSYFQSKDYNLMNGGIERVFAPLHPHTINNIFFKELILFNFKQFFIKEEFIGLLWKVGIHQLRIIAEPGIVGLPTPEGIHQDGEMLTSQHLIQRENISGGTFLMYDDRKQLLHQWTQLTHFDSIYFEEPRTMHAVTPIESEDNCHQGKRDVLLIGYDPILLD